MARCPAATATYPRSSHDDEDDVSVVSTVVHPDHSVNLRDDAYQPTLPHAVNDRRNAAVKRMNPEEADDGGKGEGERAAEERPQPEEIRYYDSGKETNGEVVADRNERPLPATYAPKEENKEEPAQGDAEEVKTEEREEERVKEESPNEGGMKEKADEPQEENPKPQEVPEAVQPPPAPPPSAQAEEKTAEGRGASTLAYQIMLWRKTRLYFDILKFIVLASSFCRSSCGEEALAATEICLTSPYPSSA